MIGAFALGFAVAIIALYAVVITVVAIVSLRPPRIHQFLSPGMMGFPQESFSVKTSDGVAIHGWHVPAGGETVVIACHGYLVNRCEWVPTCSFLIPEGASMVFFDHRGQGRSGSAKVTMGRDESADVLAVLDWVAEAYAGKKIVLMGSSMGAVAAVLAAVERPGEVAGLILDAPYRNLDEAAREWWSFLGGQQLKFWMQPIRWFGPLLLGFRPSSIDLEARLKDIQHIPTLLLFGTEDPIVKRDSAEALLKGAGNHSEIVWFEGATHGAGRLNDPKKFQDATLRFLVKFGLLPAD